MSSSKRLSSTYDSHLIIKWASSSTTSIFLCRHSGQCLWLAGMGVGWYLPLLICKGWQLILKQHRLFLTKGSLIRNGYDSSSKFCLNFLYVLNLFQPPLPLSESSHRLEFHCVITFLHMKACVRGTTCNKANFIDEPAIDIYQNRSNHIVYHASRASGKVLWKG